MGIYLFDEVFDVLYLVSFFVILASLIGYHIESWRFERASRSSLPDERNEGSALLPVGWISIKSLNLRQRRLWKSKLPRQKEGGRVNHRDLNFSTHKERMRLRTMYSPTHHTVHMILHNCSWTKTFAHPNNLNINKNFKMELLYIEHEKQWTLYEVYSEKISFMEIPNQSHRPLIHLISAF